MPLQYVKNRRLNDDLVLYNYTYYKFKKLADNNIKWRCKKYRKNLKCPVYCITNGDHIVRESHQHNHDPEKDAALLHLNAVAIVKTRGMTESTPGQQIYNNEMSKLVKGGVSINDMAEFQQPFNNFRKTFHGMRRMEHPNYQNVWKS